MTTKRILLLLLVLGIMGAAIGYALWNKPHENMAKAEAEVTISASTLYKTYNADETAANAQYLGKTIAVSGKVKEFSTGDGSAPPKIMLETEDDFGVICELDGMTSHARTKFEQGEMVTLKGKCDGLNLDVQLSRCVEVK